MENIILKDLFCELCALQFDKKAVYDIHQAFVHGKTLKIEKERLDSDENQHKKDEDNMVECNMCKAIFDLEYIERSLKSLCCSWMFSQIFPILPYIFVHD